MRGFSTDLRRASCPNSPREPTVSHFPERGQYELENCRTVAARAVASAGAVRCRACTSAIRRRDPAWNDANRIEEIAAHRAPAAGAATRKRILRTSPGEKSSGGKARSFTPSCTGRAEAYRTGHDLPVRELARLCRIGTLTGFLTAPARRPGTVTVGPSRACTNGLSAARSRSTWDHRRLQDEGRSARVRPG
jgi:hypothetical protein